MKLFSRKRRLTYEDERVQQHLTEFLGKCEYVFHAPIPFDMGHGNGGRSDVYIYEHHVEGMTYVTSDLIGEKQKKSNAGNFEMMICHRNKDDDWGPLLICELAYYSLVASIHSYETMGLEDGPYASDEYTVKHLLFHEYFSFEVDSQKLGIMLVLGITQAEWEWGQKHGNEQLVDKLKEKEVYPFTDLYRESVV